MNRSVTHAVLTSLCLLGTSEYAHALPPLGLTHIGNLPVGNLEIVGESAYIGTGGTVSRVDSAGSVTTTELVHPVFGIPNNVTRVVTGPNAALYVGANFGPANPFFVRNHAALFRLDEPNAPVVTWEYDEDAAQRSELVGVDRSLRGIGNLENDVMIPDTSPDDPPGIFAAEFHLDGSDEYLERPAGPGLAIVTDVSASGYALGGVDVPGTIGSGVGLWTPSGSFSFVSTSGPADSLRDRLDGQGVNIGYSTGRSAVKYGDQLSIFVTDPNGRFIDAEVLVSHSDFALIQDPPTVPQDTYLAYFPGIVPGAPTQAVL